MHLHELPDERQADAQPTLPLSRVAHLAEHPEDRRQRIAGDSDAISRTRSTRP